jgi:quercetin dioxygenase-like cupin family protein
MFARSCRLCIVYATALYIAAATPTSVADEKGAAQAHSATTAGLTAKELAKLPGVIFARELPDVPGKTLVVVALEFPPRSKQPKRPPNCLGHRHPGSAYVYVRQGTMRMGVGGQPVQLVHAGESFFEAAGALHAVDESASDTEPASGIAILILPAGAPLLTLEGKCGSP